jgi:transposase
MKRILRIGMDVNSTNYTLCAIEPRVDGDDIIYANVKVTPEPENIVQFIENLKKKINDDCDILCGYEAGCLGFSLYHALVKKGIRCTILATTTMLTQQGKRIKTDKRDVLMIAQCLADGGYHAMHIPTDKDDDVKFYLRMRDDYKLDLKKTKQRICAFCLSQGFHYDEGRWTQAHLKWLKSLGLSELDRETLDEYLITYEYQTNRIEAFDKRIEELASETEYVEKVKKLVCFLVVKTHTALSCLVETGDFQRFAKGNIYSAYLGLVPGEDSSSDNINRLSITKAGNSHVRKLLIEASKGICKGVVGHKSKDLKARQSGNPPEVIAYADKANEILRRKYYKMIRHGKKKNVAVTAVARELACFIWGMMTDNTGVA